MFDLTISDDVTMTGEERALLAGRYRVVKQLGQGGMGSVWLAEDTKLDNLKVALKMLPSILISNKRAYAQVKKEALIALKLVHPNIVQVRAFEEDEYNAEGRRGQGNPFLVMDYIEGQTLDDYLAEKGTLTEEETVKLLKPIAAALDYAHAQGVVHRDVKPGNVMIRKDGTPLVLDFGIAREIQETMTRVTGKLSSGTLMYMPPEQLNGASPKPAQDVYSFAAMVYECLAGKPPFSRGQIEFQIINNPPEPLPSQFTIGRAVMAGLAKNPEDRPASCAAVLDDKYSPADAAEVADGWREESRAESQSSRDIDWSDISHALVMKFRKLVEACRLKMGARTLWGIAIAVSLVFGVLLFSRSAGDTKTITLPGGAKMTFRWCPPGEFMMGSANGENNENPVHRVMLTEGFWLGETEVTQLQWTSVMGSNPSSFKGDNKPVENVSWDDCQNFVWKVKAHTGLDVSLPTEVQWEYACRAGTTGDYAGILNEMAWYDDNSGKQTHPVGTKKANKWGLCDMHGNVWEWCQDWHKDSYDSADTIDPTGPSSGSRRVLRGGSWDDSAQFCRSAFRSNYCGDPGRRYYDIGFRLACSAGPRGK